MFRHFRHHPHAPLFRLRAHRTLHRAVVGGTLILLGVATLLREQGLIGPFHPWLIAPAVIALSAIGRLIVRPGLHSLGAAVLNLGVAAYLVVAMEHIGGWTFATTWPVLLIAAGLALVIRALAGRRLGAAC